MGERIGDLGEHHELFGCLEGLGGMRAEFTPDVRLVLLLILISLVWSPRLARGTYDYGFLGPRKSNHLR